MTGSWWRGGEFAAGDHLIVADRECFSCTACGLTVAIPAGFDEVACE